jgi:hypothetical protein
MINSSYRNKMPVRLDHGYRAKEMTQVPWVQGSGFRVQGCGGGFAANIYEAMPEGLMNCCYARIVSPLAVMLLS